MTQEEVNLPRRKLFKGAVAAGATALVGGLGLRELFRNESDDQFIERFVKYLTEEEFRKKKLLSRKEENGVRDKGSKLSATEIEDIIWNIYNEADTDESTEGQLAILLSVIDRMLHKKNPATATGVIYKNYQYSWVDQRRFPVPKKVRNPTREAIIIQGTKIGPRRNRILRIKKLVQLVTENGSANISKIRENLVSTINSKLKQENPELQLPSTPILFYKRTDWDHNNPESAGYKFLSVATIKQFTAIERKMHERREVPVKIGSHTFYSAKEF